MFRLFGKRARCRRTARASCFATLQCRENTPMLPISAESATRHDVAAITCRSPHQVAIAALAFLTVVDLFSTQAILPALTTHYGVSAAAMGSAVNFSTVGMALASLIFAHYGRQIDRRYGIVLSLAILAVPTALLAGAPNLLTFAGLRFLQGLCMAGAFTLTLAHLAEVTNLGGTNAAFAAYITGNVASNLLGRLLSASLADVVGLSSSFQVFAALNIAGALLAWFMIHPGLPTQAGTQWPGMTKALTLVRDARLFASFAIGACILFAFVGTFTYVNFVLVSAPLSLEMMSVGLVYFVFLPSIVTTPLAGRVSDRIGTQGALWAGLSLALVGLAGVLSSNLPAVLLGLALVGVGTFLAQATATGYVASIARATDASPATASGLYLAAYFFGGILGSVVLGLVFDRWGWNATVGGLALVLLLAGLLARHVRSPGSADAPKHS